ncbi:unnamed protein product [Didymodactylos carnosus]|uniref:Uncharacterized protein n=1 Tax=Didymodactylos carnosus TaxID=1234261 RepID=A0A8S2IBF1_9BILA|nr:unnamed protein product [Didymodactylos carnosus]CAF3739750.1 unnamed protein product [Didymodactylos carnosus]
MSIGIKFLGEEILSQYNEFLQQYQIISQQLQDEIQRIDVHQLGTGLDVRNVEIAKMRSTINRILNEQRFNQRLMASQRRTEVLIDIRREELPKSISARQNIQILHENFSSEPEWKEFPIENNIQIIKEFNSKPNEEILLQTGSYLLLELEKNRCQNSLEEIVLKENISNFTNIYLYNLQQGNYTWKNLRSIKEQKQAFYKILPGFQSLENTITLDLLIDFCKGMQREYQRQYWLIWIRKTLDCLENEKELKATLLNHSNLLRMIINLNNWITN